jgi:mannose-6-phosphate isomerase-like protein (cupin superfamily)
MFIRAADLTATLTAHGPKVPSRKKVYVGKGVVPHVTQMATSISEGGCDTSIDPHVHPTMWEIYLILKGRAVFSIAGERHEAVAGDLVAVPPGETHSYRVPDGEPLDLFYFGVATDEREP